MADPYVIFPGTAGNYLSTPDVNLLDADTAHCQQSYGVWGFTGITLVGLSTPPAAPPFGTVALEYAMTQVNGTAFWNPTVANGVPISPSTEYSASIWIYVTGTGSSNCRLQLRDGDSAGGTGNTASGPIVAVPGGVWTELTVTATVAADAAYASLLARIDIDGDQIGQSCWVSTSCIRDGADTTFVPSLRIVGTLFEEIVPADMPIVFAADGTPLTVGDGWAGDGYSYRRYDGADASAPLVAEFLATDIPVAAQLPA